MYHIQENHGVIVMQKRFLLSSAAIAFSVCLFVACSDDTSANSNIIDVPAKGNVALESSFDFKISKSCEKVRGASLAKSAGEDDSEIIDSYDDFDWFTNEYIDFYVNEDGTATALVKLGVSCGVVNTIDYEMTNDTLHVSGHNYIWKNVYDPDIGDSVLTNVGFLQATCGCSAEFELNVPSKFVGAKYLENNDWIYGIVYKKR